MLYPAILCIERDENPFWEFGGFANGRHYVSPDSEEIELT